MSFLTGTSTEVLYSSVTNGTQLNTFTTEDNLQKTLPPIIIPAGFFMGPTAEGKRIRIQARGRMGVTGTPTFTISLRLLTSTTWSAAGIGFSTAALTGAAATLAPWKLDAEIVMRTMGIGAASTILVMGEFSAPGALASPFSGTIPAANTAFTAATYDNSVTNYLFLSAACSASSGSNLIQVESIAVYGENLAAAPADGDRPWRSRATGRRSPPGPGRPRSR